MSDPVAGLDRGGESVADEGGSSCPGRRRGRRVLRILGLTLVAVLVLGTGAFLLWANDTFAADPAALAVVTDDPRVELEHRDGVVVMTPTGESDGVGLVFLAGAKVDADAYAATFREAVARGTTVVIVQPFLNLAILERRPLSAFTDEAPDVESWAVGGHSMGGVKACTYAEDDGVDALVLLASYCSLGDLSDRTDLTALSLSGTADGLVSVADLDGSMPLMPADTTRVRLDGVSHAQFGAYGDQPGDGAPSVSDDEARVRIDEALLPVLVPSGG